MKYLKYIFSCTSIFVPRKTMYAKSTYIYTYMKWKRGIENKNRYIYIYMYWSLRLVVLWRSLDYIVFEALPPNFRVNVQFQFANGFPLYINICFMIGDGTSTPSFTAAFPKSTNIDKTRKHQPQQCDQNQFQLLQVVDHTIQAGRSSDWVFTLFIRWDANQCIVCLLRGSRFSRIKHIYRNKPYHMSKYFHVST